MRLSLTEPQSKLLSSLEKETAMSRISYSWMCPHFHSVLKLQEVS